MDAVGDANVSLVISSVAKEGLPYCWENLREASDSWPMAPNAGRTWAGA